MTAKEHLQSVYAIQLKIGRLQARREDIRNDLYSLGGMNTDSDRVQTSPKGDRMLELIATVDEIELDLVDEIKQLIAQKQQIMLEIERIPQENYKQLLYDRYVLCQRWEKIALDRNKGVRWIYRLHGKSLQAFEKVWNDH